MSTAQHIAQSFNRIYSDIDTQISKISCISSLSTLESCGIPVSHESQKTKELRASNTRILNIVNAAKEFDREIKSLTEKKAPSKKTKKGKSVSFKSSMPPIWDTKKLQIYIDNVINEFDIPFDSDSELDEEHVVSEKQTKSILKNDSRKVMKRNIGTNVKFVTEKKCQEIHQKPLPLIPESVVKPPQVTKNNLQRRKMINSQNGFSTLDTEYLNFLQHDNKSFSQNSSLSYEENLPKQEHSMLTITSTNYCSIDDNENRKHDMIPPVCYLATEQPKQMTKCFLPSMSVKGDCQIQRIYQMEILSSRGHERNEVEVNKNVRFFEFSFLPSKIDVVDLETQKKVEHKILNKNSDDDDCEKATVINNINNTLKKKKKIFRKHKVPVVKFKKPSSSHITQPVNQMTVNTSMSTKSHKEFEFYKRDYDSSSISSSLSGGESSMRGVILHHIKAPNKDKKSLAPDFNERRNNINDSNYSSSPQMKNNSKNNEIWKKNFNNFCENVNDIFVTETLKTPTSPVEQKEEIDQMNALLKVSEENIQKAGRLLEKYRKQKTELDVTLRPCAYSQTQTEEFQELKNETLDNENDHHVTSEAMRQCLKINSSTQTTTDKNVQTDENVNLKSHYYFKDVYKKYSNFDLSSLDQFSRQQKQHQQTCRPTSANSDLTNPRNSTLNSLLMNNNDQVLPYNTSYATNDDVMKMAHKFLRSVEKEKKGSSDTESSSSVNLNVQKKASPPPKYLEADQSIKNYQKLLEESDMRILDANLNNLNFEAIISSDDDSVSFDFSSSSELAIDI